MCTFLERVSTKNLIAKFKQRSRPEHVVRSVTAITGAGFSKTITQETNFNRKLSNNLRVLNTLRAIRVITGERFSEAYTRKLNSNNCKRINKATVVRPYNIHRSLNISYCSCRGSNGHPRTRKTGSERNNFPLRILAIHNNRKPKRSFPKSVGNDILVGGRFPSPNGLTNVESRVTF